MHVALLALKSDKKVGMKKLVSLLLVLMVSCCFAQVPAVPPADSLTIATFRPLPPPPDLCSYLAPVDTASVAARLDRGELAATESDESASVAAVDSFTSPIFRCENGPKKIIHTVPKEFHWPPIKRGSCDNLFCRDSLCFARKKIWRTACVHVFKLVNGKWTYAGQQLRRYLDHLSCGCKRCDDIFSQYQCVNTKPCPNSYNFNSFCYWTPFFFTIKPPTIGPPLLDAKAEPEPEPDSAISPIPLPIPIRGRCRCCTPQPCKKPKIFVNERCRCECPPKHCPYGQIFNRTTCECDCRPGSKKNEQGICVADCEKISTTHCRFVQCAHNPHFSCKVDGYKCKCPTCDDASPHQCAITKCTEQKLRPRCKYDYYSQSCRCPRCEDQIDRPRCEMTSCGLNNHLQCRWLYNTCQCPHY